MRLVTLRGRAAWAHNFDTKRALAATFQALPGTGFLVNGAAQAVDAALVSTGAEIGWGNGLSLAVTFESGLRRQGQRQIGVVGRWPERGLATA
jgi:uncharacterized protein with beta-barrel porin domain